MFFRAAVAGAAVLVAFAPVGNAQPAPNGPTAEATLRAIGQMVGEAQQREAAALARAYTAEAALRAAQEAARPAVAPEPK